MRDLNADVYVSVCQCVSVISHSILKPNLNPNGTQLRDLNADEFQKHASNDKLKFHLRRFCLNPT